MRKLDHYHKGDFNDQTARGIALIFAQHDPTLQSNLTGQGFDEKQQADHFHQLHLMASCSQIRSYVMEELKGKRGIRDKAVNYSKTSNRWIEGKTRLPFPAHLELQALEPLTPETLPDYLTALESLAHRLKEDYGYRSVEIVDIDSARTYLVELLKPFFKEGNKNIRLKPFSKEENKNTKKKVEMAQVMNLETQLRDYANQGETQAMEVLMRTLRKGPEAEDSALMADTYLSLFKYCLEKLKHNKNFIGSLINLMYEETLRRDPNLNRGEVLTGRHSFTLMIEGLKAVGIAREVKGPDFTLKNPGEPRDACHFSFNYLLQNGEKSREDDISTLAIPAEFAPSPWKEHRLVDPRLSQVFGSFAPQLNEKAKEVDQSDQEAQMAKYRKELKENRRYALDFARIHPKEIPAPKDHEVWLHYFYDEDLPTGYIGVEMVLKNIKTGKAPSVVYVMDQDLNLVAPSSIRRRTSPDRFYHPIVPENTGALAVVKSPVSKGKYASAEHMYIDEGGKLYEWANERSHTLLNYYFAKYAHCLLVNERQEDVSEKMSAEKKSPSKSPNFSLSLEDYFSQATLLPEVEGGGSDRKSGRRNEVVMIFHMVSGFRRKLKPGEEPSEEAIELAKEAGLRLKDESGKFIYTFVRNHARGTAVGQETHDVRKRKKR